MDEESDASYTYSGLSNCGIRFLSIIPGGDASKVTCHLDHITLNASREYSALSYTWGEVGLSETVTIQSRSSDTQAELPITPNCKSALLALRRNGHLTVWIDAICINQNNDEEKVVQVAKMREIYSQASKVHVFLGQVVVDDLQLFYEFNELPMKALQLHGQGNPEVQKIFATLASRDWNETAFSKSNRFVETILKNHYFSRVWILQELTCARVAYALFSNAPEREWTQFMQFLKASDASRKVYGAGITAELPKVMRLQGETDPKALGLLRLLFETRQADATNLRDKVYALLGISADAATVSIPINYSTSVANVFTTTARRLIECSGSLEMLSGVCQGSAMTDLPSWVPDFGMKSKRSNLTRNARTGEDAGFAASSGGNHRGLFLSSPSSTLQCKGKYIGKLASLSNPHQSSPLDPKIWGQWVMMAQTFTCITTIASLSGKRRMFALDSFEKFWHDNMLDTLARTMVAYKPDKAYPVFAKPLPPAQSFDYDTFLFHPEYELLQWQRGEVSQERSWYQEFTEHHCTGRRLAIVTSLHLALVPDDAVVGDSLYVLEGLSVPIVLRGVVEGGAYRVVGESYCHGIMDGQVNEDQQIAGWVGDWQDLKIV